MEEVLNSKKMGPDCVPLWMLVLAMFSISGLG
jgi:hypothetical protein